jgi:hypothetical protein
MMGTILTVSASNCVDQMPVDQMSVDQMFVNHMSVDQISVDQMSTAMLEWVSSRDRQGTLYRMGRADKIHELTRFRSAVLEDARIIYHSTKLAALMKRSTVMSFPLKLVFPEIVANT